MPLPPLGGAVAYGTHVGFRSTALLHKKADIPDHPYYLSLSSSSLLSPSSSSSSSLKSFSKKSPDVSQEESSEGGVHSTLTTASCSPVTPPAFPLPSCSPPNSSSSTSSSSIASGSSALRPLCFTESHPYLLPFSSSNFSILSATSPLSSDLIYADDEVFLVSGLPSYTELALHEPSHSSSSESSISSSSFYPWNEDLSDKKRGVNKNRGEKKKSLSCSSSFSHRQFQETSLWVLCCPRKADLRSYLQKSSYSQEENRHREGFASFSGAQQKSLLLSPGCEGERSSPSFLIEGGGDTHSRVMPSLLGSPHTSQQQERNLFSFFFSSSSFSSQKNVVDDGDIVCAQSIHIRKSLKDLRTQLLDKRCRWKIIRANTLNKKRQDVSPSFNEDEDQKGSTSGVCTPQHKIRQEDSSSSCCDRKSLPIKLDEEILFQNCYTGRYLSLQISSSSSSSTSRKTPKFSSHVVMLPSPAFSVFPSSQDSKSSSFSESPQQRRDDSSSSSPPPHLRCEREMSFSSSALSSHHHSGWRISPSSVRTSPYWDRIYPCTLLGPSEIDDFLLKKETFRGFPLSYYMLSSHLLSSYKKAQERERGHSDRTAFSYGNRMNEEWFHLFFFSSSSSSFLLSLPPLSLSPYIDDPVSSHISIKKKDRRGASLLSPSPEKREKEEDEEGEDVFSSSSSLRGKASVRPSLSESWRQVDTDRIGENEWAVHRLSSDWGALTREVKERFVLEDLLFCLSGLDGTLMIPSLLPAALSLRLLLVFLELAERRSSSLPIPQGRSWGGEVAEAFCCAIKKILEEVGIKVGTWEGEIRRGKITLQ
ncbi:spc97 spc98 family protein, partial [Cystoisospora suis]